MLEIYVWETAEVSALLLSNVEENLISLSFALSGFHNPRCLSVGTYKKENVS
jgi:hypothetical protein